MKQTQELLQILIQEAQKAEQQNEVPVSCLITKDNQIIAKAHNMVETTGDKSQHAEFLALETARKHLKTNNFSNLNLKLYSTLEPCCMCFPLISYYRVPTVYYFLEDEKFGGHSRIFHHKSAFFQPEIYHIESAEVKKIMQNFFLQLR